MLIRTVFNLLLTAALVACGGGGESPSAGQDSNAVASLEWVTQAPLFTASGQTSTLQARALNASGQVLNVPIRWNSSEPGAVSIEENQPGQSVTLTSRVSQGTAQITASAGDRTLTAIAVVSTPAAGTVVLADMQIDGEPQATTSNAPLRVGSTYTIRLKAGEPAPTLGQLVIGQGNKAIAGEVVAVNGQTVTLALVPLQRLLPNLQLDLDLPLVANATSGSTSSNVAASNSARAHQSLNKTQAQTSFSVAGFDCDAEGSAGGVELAKKDVSPLGLDTLRYRVLWNSSQKMLRLSGQPGVQFELEPSAKLAFSGKVDCKLELADVPIPLPPTIGLFLGVGFPVGVGFTMEGALPVNGVALNLKGQAQATVVVGFDCNPTCSSLNSITPTGSVTPTLTAPEFTANSLDLSGQVYAWANFEGGARWSSTLQFDAIEAQAGLKFTTKVATENAQAKEAASAGDYKLSFEASAGPTEALGDMADLVGLILDQAKFETSVPLGRSPTATFTADKTSFKAGDDVRFQVDLNSDEVLFPLQGYNVQSVRVYRKTVAENGSYVLVLANEQRASNGQTQFTIPWLATVDSGSNISFVAFVQTRLLNDLRWQVGHVGSVAGTVAPLSGNLSYTESFSDVNSVRNENWSTSLQANLVAKDGVLTLENITGSHVYDLTTEILMRIDEGTHLHCVIIRKQKEQTEITFTGPFSVSSTGLAVAGNTVTGLGYMNVIGTQVVKKTLTSTVQSTEGDCTNKDLSTQTNTETFPSNTHNSFPIQLAVEELQLPVVTGQDGIRRVTYSANISPSPGQSITASFVLTGVPN